MVYMPFACFLDIIQNCFISIPHHIISHGTYNKENNNISKSKGKKKLQNIENRQKWILKRK